MEEEKNTKGKINRRKMNSPHTRQRKQKGRQRKLKKKESMIEEKKKKKE